MDDTIIKKIIYRNYESRNIDYKSSRPWEGITKEKLIKHILCFANAGGGYIVIGYDENCNNIEEKRTGISEEHLLNWETTKVNEYLNNYCSPSLNIKVIPYEDKDESKKYIILDIPSHDKTPHICIKEKQNENGELLLRKGAIYYRTKNDSCSEIYEIEYWDDLLQRCLRNRKEELFKSFEEILEGIDKTKIIADKIKIDIFKEMDEFYKEAEKHNKLKSNKDLTYYEICGYPVKLLDKITDISIKNIDNALKEASVDYRGWPYIFYILSNPDVSPKRNNKGIFACNNQPLFREFTFYYWYYKYKGIFYSRNLTPESSFKTPKEFVPKVQVEMISEALISIGRLYNALGIGLDEEIEIGIRYKPTNGLRVSSGGRYPLYESEPFSDDQLIYKFSRNLKDFLNSTPILASNAVFALTRILGYPGDLDEDYFKKVSEEHLKNPKRI